MSCPPARLQALIFFQLLTKSWLLLLLLANISSEDKSVMTICGGPPMSNTRTSLPQIKSKFDLEPNPFEQSFKDNPAETIHANNQPNTISPSLDHLLNGTRSRRARSSSPHHFAGQPLPTPSAIRQSPDSTLAKVSLPGINFITSPAILIHHSGTDSSKSLSPPSLTASHSAQASRPSSMLAYPWNFGGLGDSLRTGPLSPALLDGPAPTRATQTTTHTGLTPLLDSSGAITPGTQALIALLSGNEENNDIRAPVGGQDQILSATAIGTSNNPTDLGTQNQSQHSMSLAHQVDQDLRSTISINTPSSNPESLNAASHRSTGPTFPSIAPLPIDTTSKSSTSSSAFKDLMKSSTSANCSPSTTSRALDPIKTNIISSHSRLASISSTPINDPNSSTSSNSLQAKSEFSLNPCVQSSIATSLGPSVVKTLHSASSIGLSQPTLSAIGSFPGSASSAKTSRSSFAQSAIPLPIPPTSPMQSVTEITAPLSPAPTSRSFIAPLPPNPGDAIDDQYNANPLYLLTVAHEESSRMSQLSNHSQALDDATATAAAALTGLGSSGGSRYSSPGPSMNPNGPMNSQHPVINNIHSSQSMLLIHEGNGTSSASPALPLLSLQPNALPDPSSINPRAILCTDNEANMLSAHQTPPFNIDRREPAPNGLLPEGVLMASGSTTQLSHQPNYPAPNIGLIASTNGPDVNGRQSFPSLDSSAVKKKSKKRKEGGDIEPENTRHNGMGDANLLRSTNEAQSSHCLVGPPVSRTIPKSTRSAASTHKAKKSKKSKTEDASGDDSDSRDGYWGPEEDSSFMRQQGGEEGDSGGYPTQSHTNPNYYSNQPPTTNQGSSSGKPETEEEKRKNFLERNRQAALKCRQRKKAWLANLQTKIEFLSTENESLQLTINRLREEVDSFRNILISHKDCPLNIAGGHGAATTIGDVMGRDPSFVAASAAAILTQQHHENSGRMIMRHPTAPNSLHGQAHIAATLSSANRSIRRSHQNSHGAVAPSFGY